MNEILVTKRDGRVEPLDLEKLHKVVYWATEGITGVSASEVELRSHLQFYNKIKTSEIQETLIKASADLISEETPNYQFVGGRLIAYHLRKEVYGSFTPWHIKDLVKKNIKSGFYDAELGEMFDDNEWDVINEFIKHERDEHLTYIAMEQLRGKYLVQNRVTGEILETPQVAYALIAAILFSSYPKEVRLHWAKQYYDAISTHEISLPTPVMAGVRTGQRQFSSCVLIESDDSLDSITATTSAIVKYVSQRAGIGIGAGRIRALGSPIRGGQAYHTGLTPYFKLFESAVNSCSQGGIRKGSATLYYPIWHLEIETLLVLKNNKGIDQNRVRFMDYGVQFNRLMYERLIEGGNITLFSPADVPELYESFFKDQDKFRELYEKAERNNRLRKKVIPALELFSMFMQERKDTGRIYLMNVDHANTHSSFLEELATIYMSNLCSEIDLPTKPLNHIHDENGEIALCTLSAINWGTFRKPQDMERACTLAVRGLDALLSYQNYPVKAAQIATELRRPIGIGIINLAYFLAKHNVRYSDDSALELVDEWAQHWSYYLIKASADLAKDFGGCPGNHETKYSKGLLPIDTYKKEVDELVKPTEYVDWNGLREQIKETGIRNSTLMALMPSETSSQIANATNGVEPPRNFVSVKQSKDGVLKQVVPEFRRLKNKYELLWDQKSPAGYLKIMCVLQKYIDQGISVNTSYNPQCFEDEQIPMSVMLKDLLMFYKFGGKQLYYLNTYDGQGEVDVDKIVGEDKPEEEICESCAI
jgi:ribonucleoside-diphosphate reductase alpha chain